MADQGELVDENGEKISDLEKSGIRFSETMTQGFDRVVAKLDELIARLQGAGQAIAAIPNRTIQIDYQETGRPVWDVPTDTPILEMGRGGFGRVNRPTLFLGPALQRDYPMIDALRRDIRTVLPRAISDAVILTGRV